MRPYIAIAKLGEVKGIVPLAVSNRGPIVKARNKAI